MTGFTDRTHRAADGTTSRYAVFAPSGADRPPVVLFLHGAGAVGTDGRSHLTGGLAPAVRRKPDFPCLTVFPQAQSRDRGWLADGPDGRRAVAILDEVLAAAPHDPKRVYLSGLSMGGHRVWSLAAAHPARWAAIVPLCHGGEPADAPKLKDIPRWCVHGDADRTVPVGSSRAMIRAVRAAGGQPIYQEYAGVDHNCWDRAYADPDLWEWLLLQKRK